MRIFIIILIVCFTAGTAQNKWKKLNGPVGGVITGLYAVGDTLLAGTGINGGLIFYSTNGGQSWEQTNIKLGENVVSFIETNDGAFMASAEFDGFHKSYDLKEWSKIYGIHNHYLYLGKDKAGIIYNSDNGGRIYSSSDNGRSWSLSYQSDDTWGIQEFLLTDDSTLYAGGNNRIINKKHGQEWKPVYLNFSNQFFNALTDDKNNLLVYSSSYIYKNKGSDSSWEKLDSNFFFKGNYIRNMIINSRFIVACNDETGWFGDGWGVALSDDNGLTWRWHNEGLPPKFSSASRLVKSGSDTYLGTNAAGVFKSTDFGGSWFPVNNGINAAVTKDVYIDDEGIMYTASWSNGIQKSSDNGDSWEVINNGLTNSYCYSVIADDDGILYAGTDQGTFRSTDKGAEWERTAAPGNDFVYFFHKDNSGRVYALTYGTGLYRSSDKGYSWVRLDKNWVSPYVISFAVDSTDNIYAGTRGGAIYKSSDDGESWAEVYRSSNSKAVVSGITVSNDGIVYAANVGMLYSTDGGLTWVTKNDGLPTTAIKRVVVSSSGDIYTAGAAGNVYIFRDGGESWEEITSELRDVEVYNMIIDKEDIVYLATDESAWRSNPDSGVTAAEEIKVIDNYSLSQNYPNPFNPSTKIKYQIPEAGHVTLKVYDILGREAAVLIDKFQSPGEYETHFQAGSLSSGIYFYKLTAGNFTVIKKMQFLK